MFGSPTTVNGNNIDLARRKQINTLMIFNENVSEIQPGSQYSVEFTTTNKTDHPAFIYIFLPPGFPKERPSLRVKAPPGMHHPWLDQSGFVVSAPGLVNYTMHSDLGRLVQAVKRDLEKNLKPLEEDTTKSITASTSTRSNPVVQPIVNNNNSHHNQMQYNHQPIVPNQQTSHIPGLRSMSLEELKALNASPMELKLFVKKMDIHPLTRGVDGDIKALNRDIQVILEESGDVQEKLVSANEAFESQRHSYLNVRDEVYQLYQETSELSKEMSEKSIIHKLRLESADEDQKSDIVAESFLDGEASCEDFLSSYMKL